MLKFQNKITAVLIAIATVISLSACEPTGTSPVGPDDPTPTPTPITNKNINKYVKAANICIALKKDDKPDYTVGKTIVSVRIRMIGYDSWADVSQEVLLDGNAYGCFDAQKVNFVLSSSASDLITYSVSDLWVRTPSGRTIELNPKAHSFSLINRYENSAYIDEIFRLNLFLEGDTAKATTLSADARLKTYLLKSALKK